MKKLLLTTLCGVALHSGVVAQDLHFSQTIQTPLLINPAAAGVFDGWERISVNHRNQWLGTSTSFMSTSIAADANFAKTEFNDRAYFGVGLMFYTDVGGDGNFGNQQGSLTLSGILPMGRTGSTLSAGIQGGFGQRSVNVGALTFNSQWNGNGFDPTINSGETNLGNSFAYIDASGGLLYQYDGGQNTFARNNDFKFQLGVSGYHLNAPELKYSSGFTDERLARKWVAHARMIKEIPGNRWSLDASAAQFIQGGHYETIVGGMARWRFENGTKITGMAHNAYLAFGSYFRVRDAIIPTVMVDWRGFQFGVSYDVTVSKLRTVNNGSLEFSLVYRNLNDSVFKTKYRKL